MAKHPAGIIAGMGGIFAKAVAAYQAVIEQAPEHHLAAWCALDIVRTRHLAPADQPVDYERLVHDYAEVYQRYPHSPAGEEAFLYQSTLSLHLADREQARKLLEQINAVSFFASRDALLVAVL